MLLTKNDRAQRKMKEDFRHVKLDPMDFGGIITVEQMEAEFKRFCHQEQMKMSVKKPTVITKDSNGSHFLQERSPKMEASSPSTVMKLD